MKMSLKKWIRAALYRAYSISFTSTNVWKTVSKHEVQEKKKKVVVLSMCPRSPENMKLGSFTSYVQWRQRNLQKSVMHVQSFFFANLNLLFFFYVPVAVAVVIA